MNPKERLTRQSLQNLKSDEVKKRIEAVKHLTLIAEGFGVNRTLKHLLPFIKEYENEDEEVLLELARQLYHLGKYVSSKKDGVVQLVPYFYILLSYEDLSVINAGMANLSKLMKELLGCHEILFVLVKKLCSLGYPKALISAARIYCELHEYMPSKYFSQFKKILAECIKSQAAVVRKETAVTLRHVFKDGNPLETAALGGLQSLLEDKLDTVKVHALESLMANEHSTEFFMKHVYPLVVKSSEFRNWRIRYVIAKSLPKLLASSSEEARLKFVEIYLKLVEDQELEVAEQAIINLRTSATIIGPTILDEQFLPVLSKLAAGETPELKVAVAGSVLYFAPVFGKAHAIEKIKGILLTLLQDGDSEVKVQLLKHHQPLGDVISIANLINLLNPVMKQLLVDKEWKVRDKNIEAYEIYLSKLGENFCSAENILEDLRNSLRDRVYIIRRKFIALIAVLCKRFGQAWSEKHAAAIFRSFAKHPNYLLRLNYLFGLSEIFGYLGDGFLMNELEKACKLANDKVGNVRYNLLLLLLRVYMKGKDERVMGLLLKVCKVLEEDEDGDVKLVVSRVKVGSTQKVDLGELIEDKTKMNLV